MTGPGPAGGAGLPAGCCCSPLLPLVVLVEAGKQQGGDTRWETLGEGVKWGTEMGAFRSGGCLCALSMLGWGW